MIQLLSTEVLDYVNLKSFHLDNYTDDDTDIEHRLFLRNSS